MAPALASDSRPKAQVFACPLGGRSACSPYHSAARWLGLAHACGIVRFAPENVPRTIGRLAGQCHVEEAGEAFAGPLLPAIENLCRRSLMPGRQAEPLAATRKMASPP